MRFVIKQSPGTVLLSVFSASAGIMLFDSASHVIRVSECRVCLSFGFEGCKRNTQIYLFKTHEVMLTQLAFCSTFYYQLSTVLFRATESLKIGRTKYSQRPSLRDALAKLSYSPSNTESSIIPNFGPDCKL